MAASQADQYFTYEARLNSFQKITKKRGSTAGGRSGKALNWPHKKIAPEDLARAGFFFRPTPENPDNTVCFLCEKGLDGWEAGDDPLLEHLKHAPQCGWAVVVAIEAEIGSYGQENPNSSDMIEARKATFGGKWPHDGKKGWKCKTKQLVEAGWKYTPTLDSDDMATCTYCQLALDGWEPNDKPFEEHYSRSPACPFFSLTERYKAASKNSGRAKSSRTSRLSVQSMASETTALTDQTTPEDSVINGTSILAQQGTKKTRAKKGTATRTTKRKAKKEEPSEILEDSQQAGDETSESQMPSKHKAKRGRKRGSEAVEGSVLSATDGPASKKRTARTPTGTTESSSLVDDAETTDCSVPHAGERKMAQASKSKALQCTPESPTSPSNASVASLRAPPGSFPDDDEIERQLEEDLARQLSEAEIAQDSDSERSKAKVKRTSTHAEKVPTPPQRTSAAYAMFDPEVPEPNEDSIDDELKVLQAEMEVDEPEAVPHKKTGAEADGEEDKSAEEEESEDQHEEDHDMTVGSTDTVLKKVYRGAGAKKDRPSANSFTSAASHEEDELVRPVEAVQSLAPPAKRGRGRPSKASLASQASNDGKEHEAPPKRGRGRPSKESLASRSSVSSVPETKEPTRRSRGRPSKKSLEVKPKEEEASTPMKAISPAPSARQPVLSPSQSPQSSDAENQPPLRSIPPASLRRMVLAPSGSPARLSPSKRNVLAGLKSNTPWTAADLEAIFGTRDVEEFIKRGGELSSPEKRMTVEEWIYYNAGEAEKKLKHECETLVSRFESEGGRAINVLEGLEVE